MGARGEVVIHAENREVPVLFTNRALAMAENRLKMDIREILNKFGITETVVLLHVGMEAARVDSRAGGKPYSMNNAYEVLDQVGYAKIAEMLVPAIADVISYMGEDNSSENGSDPNV